VSRGQACESQCDSARSDRLQYAVFQITWKSERPRQLLCITSKYTYLCTSSWHSNCYLLIVLECPLESAKLNIGDVIALRWRYWNAKLDSHKEHSFSSISCIPFPDCLDRHCIFVSSLNINQFERSQSLPSKWYVYRASQIPKGRHLISLAGIHVMFWSGDQHL